MQAGSQNKQQAGGDKERRRKRAEGQQRFAVLGLAHPPTGQRLTQQSYQQSYQRPYLIA